MESEGVKELKMKWMRMLFEEEEELEWMKMKMDWFGMELEGEWMMWMELMEGWEWMWIERWFEEEGEGELKRRWR